VIIGPTSRVLSATSGPFDDLVRGCGHGFTTTTFSAHITPAALSGDDHHIIN
jgi:hypothetical protein